MTINKLAIALTETDINAGLTAAFTKMGEAGGAQAEALKKIKDPKVVLKDGVITFKCKAAMGFLPVPVEAQIRLTPAQSGTALDITLSKIALAMMGGDSAVSAIMGQVATAIAGKPGLAVNGNTLTVALKALADLRGIQLGGTLNSITVENATLALDFS